MSGISEGTITTLENDPPVRSTRKPVAFWMSFLAICIATFLSALELSGIGTILPTMTTALDDTKGNFTWVGASYALASTAFIPLSGTLANIIGRKPILQNGIILFAIGSAICGAAQSMNMMIAGRTVQGVGGGCILTVTEILVADMVPLAERGAYQGLVALTWAFSSAIGPPIGGALASSGTKTWRWMFYLNLPLTALSFFLVQVFLHVKKPEGSISSKLKRVDWIGNVLIIIGSGLANIGLTWGGVRYSWTSVEVLAPLIIGLALVVAFGFYEAIFPAEPTIPRDLFKNRTTISGLLAAGMHGLITIALIYYFPVYLQACLGDSPIKSALDMLPSALIMAPVALVCGITITATGKYRPVNWLGWCVVIPGFGLFSTLRANSPMGHWVGYQLLLSGGIGILYAGPLFPIMAPLPISHAAAGLALFLFVRAFMQTWGITIAATVLQNQLKKNLPADFVAQFPVGFEIAYSAIDAIETLEEPLRFQVRQSFAESMGVVWLVMAGIGGLGLLGSLVMREVKLTTTIDESYALKGEGGAAVAAGDDEDSAEKKPATV